MLVGSFPADLCRGHKWKSLGISETETLSSGSFTVSIVTPKSQSQPFQVIANQNGSNVNSGLPGTIPVSLSHRNQEAIHKLPACQQRVH
ncbi:hypothetical protein RRG08_043018 [Elysia crispata]|uniref:Uncharacterized protein n=1 Tax=Elysia crispata TaxID=231223 RepID=A0AAE0XZF8_9GAST|nr:hypothetical protein RRG08_043018 [Elysia crispata]